MKNYLEFIDESKILFENYLLNDNKTITGITNRNETFVSIQGDYYLNRKYNNVIYKKKFNISVYAYKSNNHVLPYLIVNKKDIPQGFTHIYVNGCCCLGLQYEIYKSWGNTQNAQNFFDNIIDTFLMNLIEFLNTKTYLNGDHSHGSQGILEYYTKILRVDFSCCENLLSYMYNKLIHKEKIKGHNLCPCNSGKQLKHCHMRVIFDFYKDLYNDKTLCNVFKNDYLVILSERMRNESKKKI